MMQATLNISNLVDALLFVERETGRSVTDSLNRAALHVIIGSAKYPGAMKLTPKADRSKIAAIPLRQLQGFVIRRNKRQGKGKMTTAQIMEAARKERRRRCASIGFTAFVGWNKAARQLGGRGIRGVQSGFPSSSAFKGWGRKASIVSKVATIVNTATAAEKIGFPALQQSINNAAKDLEDYATKKMQQHMRRVQP